MKIDMHVHTSVSSPCSNIDPARLPDLACTAGLDALCVTEHDEMRGADVAAEVGREQGFPIFKGVEIYTEFGDMLVFGLDMDAPSWRTPFADLTAMCRTAGAIIVPAHPCRIPGELERVHGRERVRAMIAECVAIETHNGGCTPQGNAAACELAADYGLPGIGGSDSHHEFQVGRSFTLFECEVTSMEDLMREVRAGRCQGMGPTDDWGSAPIF